MHRFASDLAGFWTLVVLVLVDHRFIQVLNIVVDSLFCLSVAHEPASYQYTCTQGFKGKYDHSYYRHAAASKLEIALDTAKGDPRDAPASNHSNRDRPRRSFWEGHLSLYCFFLDSALDNV